MRAAKRERLTETQYFAIAEASLEKLEYLDGEVYAMSGGTAMHALIAINVATGLKARLGVGGCRVFSSDLRIHCLETGLYTYPDLSVVCGPLQYLGARRDTITNPVVVVEVLSPSTEAYDRGEKFEHYRRIASLRHYVVVASERAHVERFDRCDDGSWSLRDCVDFISIPALNATLPLAELYAEVEFPTPPPRNEEEFPTRAPR